ncbi:MAG: DUF433 domain-containing protein [Thermomicrobiales bacterium]
MQSSTRITRNPEVLGGRPIVRGTRIAVDLIEDWVVAGQTSAQIIADYPSLTLDDIEAALAYARSDRKLAELRIWAD